MAQQATGSLLKKFEETRTPYCMECSHDDGEWIQEFCINIGIKGRFHIRWQLPSYDSFDPVFITSDRVFAAHHSVELLSIRKCDKVHPEEGAVVCEFGVCAGFAEGVAFGLLDAIGSEFFKFVS